MSLAAISDREDDEVEDKPGFISKMLERLTPKKDSPARPRPEGAAARNATPRQPLSIRHTPGIYLEDSSVPSSPVQPKVSLQSGFIVIYRSQIRFNRVVALGYQWSITRRQIS